MSQRDKENFKEYAQRWRKVATHICPPLKEREMSRIYLKTLIPFYYERMIASELNEFNDVVNMGMRIEEGVHEGRLVKEGGSSSSVKKFGVGFPKKKEQDVSTVVHRRPRQRYQ